MNAGLRRVRVGGLHGWRWTHRFLLVRRGVALQQCCYLVLGILIRMVKGQFYGEFPRPVGYSSALRHFAPYQQERRQQTTEEKQDLCPPDSILLKTHLT